MGKIYTIHKTLSGRSGVGKLIGRVDDLNKVESVMIDHKIDVCFVREDKVGILGMFLIDDFKKN